MVHPDWLHKKVREKEDTFRQRKLVDIFGSFYRDGKGKLNMDPIDKESVEDLEDFRNNRKNSVVGPRPIVRCYINNEQPSVNPICEVHCSKKQNDGADTVDKEHPSLQKNALILKAIDRNADYQGWLEMKKRKWRESRERRKRLRYPFI